MRTITAEREEARENSYSCDMVLVMVTVMVTVIVTTSNLLHTYSYPIA